MRSDAEYEEAMRWIAWGLNLSATSRLVDVPQGTIKNWKNGTRCDRTCNACPRCGSGDLVDPAYAYLPALYLGDGYIVKHGHRGVFRLSITQDIRHIGLIGECAAAIDGLVVDGGPRSGFRERPGCIEVASFWRHWPCLLPQP
jgi:hypothetical protein